MIHEGDECISYSVENGDDRRAAIDLEESAASLTHDVCNMHHLATAREQKATREGGWIVKYFDVNVGLSLSVKRAS